MSHALFLPSSAAFRLTFPARVLKHFSLPLRHLHSVSAGSILVKNAFLVPLPLVGNYFALGSILPQNALNVLNPKSWLENRSSFPLFLAFSLQPSAAPTGGQND